MTAPAFFWFIPNSGDGRDLVDTAVRHARGINRGARHIDIDYLRLVARAAQRAGFSGAMMTTGAAAEDGFVLAAALAADVPGLQLLVGYMPGMESPVAFAQKAATLQQITSGRLLLGLIGSSSVEHRGYGDFLGHDERYARTDEFLALVQAFWRGEGVEYAGRHHLLNTGPLPATRCARPPLYVFGASPAAVAVVARHADVHMFWGETPEMIGERIAGTRRAAGALGRSSPAFGLRVHVIARPTRAEAWQEADRLLRALPREVVEIAQRHLARTDSVGQQRMLGLHQGRPRAQARDLEVAPGLWAGIGLVRSGSGTALIGSYDDVAQRIGDYARLGISRFVFSGYPNLEEARRVGTEVLPRVRGLATGPAPVPPGPPAR